MSRIYHAEQQVPDQRLVDLIGRRYDAIVASGIGFHEALPALPQKLKKDGKRRVGHKLKQKISGCFRSAEGADDVAVIRTLIGTAKKQRWGSSKAS